MVVRKLVAAAFLAVACAAIPRAVHAQGVAVGPKAIDKAVEKGVRYLKGLTKPDGSFIRTEGLERLYPEGTTALVLFTFLKSGLIDRNDPLIVNSFKYIRSRPFRATYSVSLLILALEARYAPRPKPAAPRPQTRKKPARGFVTVPQPPVEKVARRNFQKKASPQDRKLLEGALRWLLSKQQTNIWRYPGSRSGGETPENTQFPDNSTAVEDFSNTQYAMLALNAARRLGYPIGPSVWHKVVDYCLKHQQDKGPEVKWFPVPAADFPITKLRKMRDQYLRELTTAVKQHNKQVRKAARKGQDPQELGLTKDGPRTTVAKPEPYREYGAEKQKMYARGWSYYPRANAVYYGSMTTSGVAALVICKDALEAAGKYKPLRKKVDQAIRDGCAWLAYNFTVSGNPGSSAWHYYYLYGLERAGVLSLARQFGQHKWYEEGVAYIVGAQSADGSWPAQGHCSQLSNTCFALLFLKRATTPIIHEPEGGIYTGTDLFGTRKHDK